MHHPTRTLILAALAASGAGAASAAEFGVVTSVTPATQQVPTSQRQCWQQEHLAATPPSGGGAVAGAVVGGVLGHGLGGGPVGTAIGALVGAGVGNDVEAASTPPTAYTTQRCRNVAATTTQTVYDVQYDYNGQHYSVKMASAPAVGSQLPLDITATGALPPAGRTTADAGPPPADGTVTYVQQPPVVYSYPYYATPYVYPAVTVGVGYPRVWIGGRWGWGWRRW